MSFLSIINTNTSFLKTKIQIAIILLFLLTLFSWTGEPVASLQQYYVEYLFMVRSEHISMSYSLGAIIDQDDNIVINKTSHITVSEFLYTLKHVKIEDFVQKLARTLIEKWISNTSPYNRFPDNARHVSYTYLSVGALIVKVDVVYRDNSIEYRDVKNGILLGGSLRVYINEIVVNNIELIVKENFTIEYLAMKLEPQEILAGSSVSPLISKDVVETLAYITSVVMLVSLIHTFARWSNYRIS